MRKLPEYYENPVDNIIYKFVPQQSQLLDKFSPNFITSITVVLSSLGIYFFIKKQYELAAICYLLSYFYDCVDGYHARRKKMESKFGDYYDHITDLGFNFAFIYLIYQKYKENKNFKYFQIAFIVYFILMYSHLSLQEIYYGKDLSPFLNIFNLKNKNLTCYLKYARYFGTGTYNLIFTLIIFFSKIY